MSQATTRMNDREFAAYCIASALGIPMAKVTDDVRLGSWAHYIAWEVHFVTGRVVVVFDLGMATAKDIFDQLQ